MRRKAQLGGNRYELLPADFVSIMASNMWSFMNKDTIEYILNKAGCNTIKYTTKDDINNDIWPREYWNTICFKGEAEEGHYVYVDNTGFAWGTYECKVTYKKDDGICHGFALTAALKSCGHPVPDLLKSYYGNPLKRKEAYKLIMTTYKYIIENGWWDAAILRYFRSGVVKLNPREISSLPPHMNNIKTVQSVASLNELNRWFEWIDGL